MSQIPDSESRLKPNGSRTVTVVVEAKRAVKTAVRTEIVRVRVCRRLPVAYYMTVAF